MSAATTARSPATARVLEAPGRLATRRIPVPDPGDGDAVVRVEACGLCGTDHEQFSGVLPSGFAFVPGHETIGIIEAIGEAAATRWDVAVGDRVAIEVFQSCRACDPCIRGEYRQCRVHGIGDMYGFLPVDRMPGLWGGYATHHFLGPDAVVHRVPDGLDPVVATLFNPLGAGIRWGATVPGTGPGDVVAVLGPGIRGLAAVVAAKEAGAAFVMVTGHGPNDASRLDVCRAFGADLTVDVATDDPVAALRSAGFGGADVVVDVTAKAPQAFAQAIGLARTGGTVVVAGTRGFGTRPEFEPDLIVYKELRILGALGVDRPAYAAALTLLASGRYPFASIPRLTAGLDGVEELLHLMGGTDPEGRVPPMHAVVVPAG